MMVLVLVWVLDSGLLLQCIDVFVVVVVVVVVVVQVVDSLLLALLAL